MWLDAAARACANIWTDMSGRGPGQVAGGPGQVAGGPGQVAGGLP